VVLGEKKLPCSRKEDHSRENRFSENGIVSIRRGEHLTEKERRRQASFRSAGLEKGREEKKKRGELSPLIGRGRSDNLEAKT